MDIELLRRALQARPTEWTALAKEAGLHRKTIERFCLHPREHNPNWSTLTALWRVTFERQREAA